MKRFCILTILSLSIVHLCAQRPVNKQAYRDTVRLITGPKVLQHPFRKRRLDFTLDARQTIIGNQAAKLGGFRIGMEYRRINRFGIGFFGLSEAVDVKALDDLDPNVSQAQLNLNYSSIYYERILYFNKNWEWSTTIHLGNGTIQGRYQLVNSSEWLNIMPIKVKPLEWSTSVYYNVNWWISIGTGVGYRHMRQSPSEARAIYNAPIALFKLKIKLGKLIKGLVIPEIREQY